MRPVEKGAALALSAVMAIACVVVALINDGTVYAVFVLAMALIWVGFGVAASSSPGSDRRL